MLETNAISNNSKTVCSADTTTNCPKRKTGNTCPYCYVETARDMNFNAKKVVEQTVYKKGSLQRKSLKTIKKLRQIGLRLFSFGDWIDTELNRQMIRDILSDCKELDIPVKAITKQIGFVHLFASHPSLKMIHLSVDSIGYGVNHSTAKSMRETYSNVKIRSVLLKESDVETLSFADIHTFNHGNNGFTNFSNRKNKIAKEELIAKHNLKDKTCCSTGNCLDCPVQCGM